MTPQNRGRSLLALATLALASLGVVTYARPVLADVAGIADALVGVMPGHHETKRGSEFYFELPAELTTRLDPGDVLEPETHSQRVVYYGGGIGFCIDPNRTAGDATTVYHFRGDRHERALEVAREAEGLGVPRDEAIWAMRRAEEGEAVVSSPPARSAYPAPSDRVN